MFSIHFSMTFTRCLVVQENKKILVTGEEFPTFNKFKFRVSETPLLILCRLSHVRIESGLTAPDYQFNLSRTQKYFTETTLHGNSHVPS